MLITSYKLPIPNEKHTYNDDNLIFVNSFKVSSHNGDPGSGLEGLAIDTKRNLVYAAYEKEPRMFYTLTVEGEELSVTYPYFSGDLSDIAYDPKLDLLWMLSDQSRRY